MREFRVMIVSAARLGTPASHSRIGGTISPSSNTLVAWDGIDPGTAPPMSSWCPKACTKATTRSPREHRHGDAQVGQVPDAALGQVDVVVEVHVPRGHRGQREVPDHRVHQRRVRPPGQLAQLGVVDPGPEVVGVPDHRRPGRPPDRRLHLPLDRGQRPLHDLQGDRVDAVAPRSWRPLRVTTRLPKRSTRARNPGWSGTVAPYSSTTAGPSTRSPGDRSSRR